MNEDDGHDEVDGTNEDNDDKKNRKSMYQKKDIEEIKTFEDEKPMCTIGKWTDPETSEEKYTVLVVLPSVFHPRLQH